MLNTNGFPKFIFKSNRTLPTIALFLFGVIFMSCGGGGGDNAGNGTSTGVTPSDLGWVIPETNPDNVTTLPTGEEISSEFISVIFKGGVDEQKKVSIIEDIGGTVGGKIPDEGIYYIKFSPPKTGDEIQSIIIQLRINPDIDVAGPEYMFQLFSKIPDPTDIEIISDEDKKWGFEKINMPGAWDDIRKKGIELNDDVRVAVIDTGFDLKHPDLEKNFVLEVNGYLAWVYELWLVKLINSLFIQVYSC